MNENWLVHLFYSWWNMSDYHWYPESSWWPMWILRFLWEKTQNVKSCYLKVRKNKKILINPPSYIQIRSFYMISYWFITPFRLLWCMSCYLLSCLFSHAVPFVAGATFLSFNPKNNHQKTRWNETIRLCDR